MMDNDLNEGGMKTFLKQGICPRFFLHHFVIILTISYHLTLNALKNLGTCAVSLEEMTCNDVGMTYNGNSLKNLGTGAVSLYIYIE